MIYRLYSYECNSISICVIRNENIDKEIKLQQLIASNQLKAVAETLQSWAVPEIADFLIDPLQTHRASYAKHYYARNLTGNLDEDLLWLMKVRLRIGSDPQYLVQELEMML